MYNYHELMTYISKLNNWAQSQYNQITEMNRVIRQLEENVANLEKEVQTLKERASTSIGRIEYKFDQLKVETLEGTLNIGLTPSGQGTIDEFAVDNNEMNVPTVQQEFSGLTNSIRSQINNYLKNECHETFNQLEARYNCQLNNQYREFITNDIQRQIDERIKFHINQNASNLQDPRKIGNTEQDILRKIKKEIVSSIESFIQNLPKENRTDEL